MFSANHLSLSLADENVNFFTGEGMLSQQDAFPVDGQEPDDPEPNKGRIIQFRSVV